MIIGTIVSGTPHILANPFIIIIIIITVTFPEKRDFQKKMKTQYLTIFRQYVCLLQIIRKTRMPASIKESMYKHRNNKSM